MTMRKAPVKRMPAIGLPDLLCQWIVSVAQLSVLLDSRRRWCGECMVRRPIASRIFGVLDWSAQMYPSIRAKALSMA
jgi:hypothetical protein